MADFSVRAVSGICKSDASLAECVRSAHNDCASAGNARTNKKAMMIFSIELTPSNATGQRRERASVRWSGMLELQHVGMKGGEPRLLGCCKPGEMNSRGDG